MSFGACTKLGCFFPRARVHSSLDGSASFAACFGHDSIVELAHTDSVLGTRRRSKRCTTAIQGSEQLWEDAKVNNLIEGTAVKLARLKEEAKGQSTGSNGSSSSNSFDLNNEDAGEGVESEAGDKEEDAEIEKGEEVNQVDDQVPTIAYLAQIPVAEPILVLSLGSKAADDLGFPKVAPTVEDLIEHSFN
ncbi:hypothetical protein Acr_00g0014660 [Actinidia rufa]|uniref:Uncharacterized protein n=1 Tax=Actinidia rufa TaxID=165716 RepID=A0A7J0DAD5_9ERIC|nr:hypothetical protein Acr_00g0014660 [Actinidia rufa]